MKYDWVNIYQEFANKLLEYKNNREDLINKLQNIYAELELKYPLIDGHEAGQDVCPFSVMGLFNKQISENNRINILSEIKEKFNLKSDVPTDFSGIPILNNMKSMFYHFTPYRKETDIPNLWNLFEIAIKYADNPNEENYIEFCEKYNIVIEQPLVKWNITMGLFWIRPYTYLNLDRKNREYLKNATNEFKSIRNISNLRNVPKAEEYIKINQECKKIIAMENSEFKNFIEFSDNAYDSHAKNINYWLVGSNWSSAGDQTQRFIDEGIWQNGYEDKYSKIVNSIQPGDKIAIKTSYTKSKDIPFENNGETVSVMKIKVTGTVIENMNDGKTIKVEWNEPEEKEWYMFTGRNTIWNITPKDDQEDWMKAELIKFVFEGEEQDYQKFINDPYWNNRYSLNVEEEQSDKCTPYTKSDFLKEVFMEEEQYDVVKNTLIRKKNVILQGVPGVGKTFCAKKLFFSIIGKKDDTKIRTVQFHQSYSYEDFIQGFRPNKEGKFELKNGIFYDLVNEAREEYEKAEQENRKASEYCIIIDEINRGNLSKVFGELMMLIESDKRKKEWAIKLTYSPEEDFYIPKNLYIIGTMNTADRSLAMIDYALRRRFSFITLKPAFENKKLENYLIDDEGIDDEFAIRITQMYINLNRFIKDTFKNDNFVIGHSYFINQLDRDKLEKSYNEIVEYDIKPLLEEYFFGEEEKIDEALNKIKL